MDDDTLILAAAGGLLFLIAKGFPFQNPVNGDPTPSPPYPPPTVPHRDQLTPHVALPGLEPEARYTMTQIRRHMDDPNYHGGF